MCLSFVSSLPAVRLNQFSDMTFGEFKKSFLWTEPQVTSSVNETVYINVFFVLDRKGSYFTLCLLQNCSATKGNFLSSNGPHADAIDWRKKGNYVTNVKNQVRFHFTHTFYFIDLKVDSIVALKQSRLKI